MSFCGETVVSFSGVTDKEWSESMASVKKK